LEEALHIRLFVGFIAAVTDNKETQHYLMTKTYTENSSHSVISISHK